MIRSLSFIFALSFSLLFLACFSLAVVHARTQAPTNYPVQVVSNIVYGPMPSEVLDQCTPIGAVGLRPGLVLIHGGGWSAGDKIRYSRTCRTYAAQGFVVSTINYRLTSAGYQWPDQIGDIQLAVRYMRANASSTNLDPTRMCSLGDSAGAHLALLLDDIQTIHAADVANLYPGISPSVDCVVDQFGPSDLTRFYNETSSANRQALVSLLDGQTPTSDPALYNDASPVDNISAQTGQTLIVQGSLDKEVFPDQSTELQTDLQTAGIPVQYISYVGGHEYYGLTPAQRAAILNQIMTWLISVEHS